MNHHMRTTDSNKKRKRFVNDEDKTRRTQNASNRLVIIQNVPLLTDVLIRLMGTSERISENYIC